MWKKEESMLSSECSWGSLLPVSSAVLTLFPFFTAAARRVTGGEGEGKGDGHGEGGDDEEDEEEGTV